MADRWKPEEYKPGPPPLPDDGYWVWESPRFWIGAIAVAAIIAVLIFIGSAAARGSNGAFGILALIAVASFYFLPSLVAYARSHRNQTAITVLNLVAGWTFAGWVIALVWACTAQSRD